MPAHDLLFGSRQPLAPHPPQLHIHEQLRAAIADWTMTSDHDRLVSLISAAFQVEGDPCLIEQAISKLLVHPARPMAEACSALLAVYAERTGAITPLSAARQLQLLEDQMSGMSALTPAAIEGICRQSDTEIIERTKRRRQLPPARVWMFLLDQTRAERLAEYASQRIAVSDETLYQRLLGERYQTLLTRRRAPVVARIEHDGSTPRWIWIETIADWLSVPGASWPQFVSRLETACSS
jgi:hypothetical protein